MNTQRQQNTYKILLDLVSNLVKKDIAYVAKNGVYFRVSKFNNYGKLSKKKIDDLESGSRIEIDESKDNPLDFALWKFSDDVPAWDSPWGKGRPGWHIECSAMSIKYLGENLKYMVVDVILFSLIMKMK